MRNGTICVNGTTITTIQNGTHHIEWKGDLASLTTDESVTCGNVQGDVQCGGSLRCEDVGGSVNAGGSVRSGTVGGSVNAGGSVRVN